MPERYRTLTEAASALLTLANDPTFADDIIDVEPEAYLYGPGRPPESLYLVTGGLIRLIHPPSEFMPEPRPIDWLGPGLLLGWSSVLPPAYHLWARAEQPTTVLPLSMQELGEWMGNNAELAESVVTQIGRRLKLAYSETSELIRLEAPQRLARTLVRFSHHPTLAEDDEAGKGWTTIRLTHADLAGRTGISRETVSLILSRWRARGLVKTGRKRLRYDAARIRELLIEGGADISENDEAAH